MKSAAVSTICFRVFLALFVLALTMAAMTRPLCRAKFNFAPDVVNWHQGFTRHTYLEVAASCPDLSAAYSFFVNDDLRLMTPAIEHGFEVVSPEQPDTWPIMLAAIHRRVPPSGSSDSDHIA